MEKKFFSSASLSLCFFLCEKQSYWMLHFLPRKLLLTFFQESKLTFFGSLMFFWETSSFFLEVQNVRCCFQKQSCFAFKMLKSETFFSSAQTSNQPSTPFGRAVQQAINTFHAFESSKNCELGENAFWRYPAKRAFMRYRNANPS